MDSPGLHRTHRPCEVEAPSPPPKRRRSVKATVAGLFALFTALSSFGEGSPRAAETHVVRAGDSLWSIAAQRVGDATLWPVLYRANRDQIVDPSLLYPGQRLSIPPAASFREAAAQSELRP